MAGTSVHPLTLAPAAEDGDEGVASKNIRKPRMTRATTRATRLLEITLDSLELGKPFLTLVREFVLESGLSSLVAAIIPILATAFVTAPWIQQIADQHFQTDDHPPALFLAPSAYANITCAPIKGYYTERFFMAPKGASFANHYFGPSGQTGVVAFVLTTFRALLMFRSTPRACVLVTVLGVVCGFFIAYLLNAKKEIDHVNGSKTTLGYTYEGVTAGVYVIVMPALAALAAMTSKKRRSLRQAAGAFGVFFACSLLEYICLEVMEKGLLPFFFDAERSSLGLFIARGPVMISVFTAMVEAMWQLSKFSVISLDVDPWDSHILLASATAVLPLYGRLMQSSAQSASSSIYYELIGTLVELVACHSLLKGNTPWRECVVFTKELWRRGRRMAPEIDEEADESRKSVLRRKFCASAVIMMSIGEACSILASCGYYLLINVNPSLPGSERIPRSQTLTSLAIMLVGELIVTDGIVSWMSNKRAMYKIDLSKEWEGMKEKKVVLIAIVLLTSFLSVLALVSTTKNFCFTSGLEDKEKWVLTSCPGYPNITDVARDGVGEKWLEAWDKYHSN